MNLEIVKKIVYEKDNSIVSFRPRNKLQSLRLKGLYEALILLRVLLTLIIQTGWIDQSEFTNSLEIIAGDYFDLQVFKSPSFNATFPTRSIAFLHTTVYAPYFLSSYFLSFEDEMGKEKIPAAKLLILIPRLVQVLLSLIVDFLLIKFCNLNISFAKKKKEPREQLDNEKEEEGEHSFRLITLASSMVLLVFATRTHSSSLNLIFFASILYFVSKSIHILDAYTSYLLKYDAATDPIEKVKWLRMMKRTGYNPINNLHWIVLFVVLGLFNDPEFFLTFASVPVFFYLKRGIGFKKVGMKDFHIRIFVFIFYFFAFSFPFVIWDSIYFGKVTFMQLWEMKISQNSFVFTPANYFVMKRKYFDIFNTAKTLGYFFLIFNVIGGMGVVSFVREIYLIATCDWKNKPKLDSQWMFLNCSLFIPLLLMKGESAFELVPLIFPLIYMHGQKIPLVSHFNPKLGLAWFMCNLIGVIYWGFVSQGGILTAFLDMYSQLIPIRFNPTKVDIICSQMAAIPPTFVLVIPSLWKTLMAPIVYQDSLDDSSFSLTKKVLQLEKNSKIRVFHTGENQKSLSALENDISRLIKVYDTHFRFGRENEEMLDKANFLLLPFSIGNEAEEMFERVKLKKIKTYWNHINFKPFWNEEPSRDFLLYAGKEKHKNLIGVEIGLSLYRLEQFSANLPMNTSQIYDKNFEKTFKFNDVLFHILGFFVNFLAYFFTFFIFIASYLVFLT